MVRVLVYMLSGLIGLAIIGAGGAAFMLWRYGRDLPDYTQLARYEPPTVTRVHAGDGRMITEYATERRVFVPYAAIPKHVVEAFVASEDQNFFTHSGVDPMALIRAAVTNLVHMGSNRRPVGASTITQQVTKNFLLTNEVSIERKIKEAILAFRMEQAFSKERILELYLNEIYLGYGSYGVAAAALNYFNKSLDELTIAEAAYLSALPKAPNNYHPIRAHDAAVARRNWAIGRMQEEGYIDAATARLAQAEQLTVVPREATQIVEADFFLEEVRRDLASKFGDKGLYEGGLSVRTTLDPQLQAIADEALRNGLRAYDRRHGWRGAVARVPMDSNWLARLREVPPPAGIGKWELAAVLKVEETRATIGLRDGATGTIPFSDVKWARPPLPEGEVGPAVRRMGDVVAPGDVVLVEAALEPEVDEDGEAKPGQTLKVANGTYSLRQIPRVNGALVALDPHTGRVYAMSGGYDFDISQFNWATQAYRQPGSAFKPFVYLAALEHGYTPSTIILDAPFVIDQGPGLGKWKPDNYTKRFYGPSPMRIGIEHSRNLMTVRLAQAIGMDAVAEEAERFGVMDNLQQTLSMALGAGETTLLRITTGYAMLVNGGKRITPSLIDRVQDRHGRTVYRHDQRPCEGCQVAHWDHQTPPVIPDLREQIVDSGSAYQVVSMLEGVVQRGTGRRIAELGKPLAGKTGTTNDSRDAWFIGFSPDLAVGVFVGHDTPEPLGSHETGSSVSVPIFKAFMAKALKGKPSVPFRVPPGIRLVRVDPTTGRPASAGDNKAILEAYKAGTEPGGEVVMIDGSDGPDGDSTTVLPATGAPSTGGLY
ncbi:MAG: penicillin-binding protein 1A [Alphaproteobacteria bacterium]